MKRFYHETLEGYIESLDENKPPIVFVYSDHALAAVWIDSSFADPSGNIHSFYFQSDKAVEKSDEPGNAGCIDELIEDVGNVSSKIGSTISGYDGLIDCNGDFSEDSDEVFHRLDGENHKGLLERLIDYFQPDVIKYGTNDSSEALVYFHKGIYHLFINFPDQDVQKMIGKYGRTEAVKYDTIKQLML